MTKPDDPKDNTKVNLRYSDNKVFIMRIIYVVSIIAWLLIIFLLKLYVGNDWIAWAILTIPLLIYIISAFNVATDTIETENEVFQANIFALGLLIIIPLFSWMSRDFKGNKRKFIGILILALVLSMLSIIDIWTKPEWLSVIKHGKSVLQTMALVLIVYALYTYYLERPDDVFT